MTVLEIIQRSTEFLNKKGVPSPRLQIELLLAHVLKLPRLQLYLNFERVLQEPELAVVRELVRRRGQREPLQHLTGSTSFCGLELAVNRDVLIPRPETELLAERAWQWLARSGMAEPKVLDLGTGSGCLAIAIAVNCAAARGLAIDLSAPALALARTNAMTHGMHERLAFRLGDGFAALSEGMVFDAVVSNPPYIPRGEIPTLEPEVRDYDPHLALDGGPDGLDFMRRLAGAAKPFLAPGGRLFLEFGDGQAEAVGALFAARDWSIEAVENDLTGRARIFVAGAERK